LARKRQGIYLQSHETKTEGKGTKRRQPPPRG
jgi:hypothetical protein